jgi:hypothetical protein
MLKTERIKKNCINEIINIIKKYNISIDEIIYTYIDRYQNFNDQDKIRNKLQYHNFKKYKLSNTNSNTFFKETSQKIIFPYTFIDDYMLI